MWRWFELVASIWAYYLAGGVCDVLGDETYETLTRAGEQTTTTAMATYAFDQIELARAQLLGAD